MAISKDLSQIMKCYAILFIALHNFIHLEPFGFVQENETTFRLSRSESFIDSLLNPSCTLIFDLFSFIGWAGVPVFVFISGYGLVKKYEHGGSVFNIKGYIKYNYVKLLSLLLPAFLVSLIIHSNLHWLQILKYFFTLTFLETIFNDTFISLPSAFPAFWYFSLTFQLYLFYILIHKIRNRNGLVILIVLLLSIQLLFGIYYPEGESLLRYIKLNLIGWIPFFLLGVVDGRECLTSPNIPYLKWMWPLFLILCIFMNLNFFSWIIMPFFSILFFYSLSLFVQFVGGVVQKISLWVGKMSSYIFCTHSITIGLYKEMNLQFDFIFLLLAYIILFFVLAFFYRYIHIQIKKGTARLIS